MTAPPYALPLAPAAFDRALRTGHGRAWQHAARHGVADRIDSVVNACLNNLAYDPQCDVDRAAWLLKIVEAAPERERVVTRVLAEVDEPASGINAFWHRVQRCDLLARLAKRGYADAREALYRAFGKSDDSAELIGCAEIIGLDHSDGLIWICTRLGEMLRDEPDAALGDDPLTYYDEQHGDGAATRLLEFVGRSNEAVRRYLDSLAQRSDVDRSFVGSAPARGYRNPEYVRLAADAPERARAMWNKRTAADVVAWVEETPDDLGSEVPSGAWLGSWGWRASESELAAIAERLRAEYEPVRILRYLRVFQRRRIPVFDEALIALTKHDHHHIRWVSYQVLSNVSNVHVRALALAALDRDAILEGSIELFRENWAPGDYLTIQRALFLPDDADCTHSVAQDLLAVIEMHRTPDAVDLLLYVYEHSPCAPCRRQAVALLREVNAAPVWLIDEYGYDAGTVDADESGERTGVR